MSNPNEWYDEVHRTFKRLDNKLGDLQDQINALAISLNVMIVKPIDLGNITTRYITVKREGV